MFYKNSIGIDIAPDAVAIVWLQSRLKGHVLMEHRLLPLAADDGKPVREKYEEIAGLINNFISECRIDSPEVHLSLPDERAMIRDIRFPLAIKENFRETIRFELEKYVPFPKEHIYHDCQLVAEDKQNNQTTILLVVVKKEDLDPWLQMCRLIDCGVSGIEITSTALANGLAFQQLSPASATYAFMQRQENSRLICLVHNGKLLAARSVAADAPSLPSLLAHEQKICRENNLASGESLPVFAGHGETGVEETPGAGDNAALTMHRLNLHETVPSSRLLAAFGLALRSLGKTPGQINLMPLALRKKPDRRVTFVLFSLAALNLLLLLIWGGAVMVHNNMILDGLNKEAARLQNGVCDLPQIKEKTRDAEKRIQFLTAFQNNRPYTVDILKELTGVIPQSAWINNLHLKDDTVEIEGLAGSASDLIPRLESSPLFKNVGFLSTISKTTDGKEKFKIQMKTE